MVDWLKGVGYVTDKLGEWRFHEEDRRQSRMRATEKLIARFKAAKVSPLMITQHQLAETIIVKDKQKKLTNYEETAKTRMMREQMQTVNGILSKTLVNMYMSDDDLTDLNQRLLAGKLPWRNGYLPDLDEDEQGEEIRQVIDFSRKSLSRVFNNGSLCDGGRLYGGWWQGVPQRYRKYIKINRMNSVEVDFSAMHINLIYWLQGIPVPDGDLYTLEGYPEETRQVVKQCLLTLINAKSREGGMRSIREHIRGVKVRMRTIDGKKEKTEKKIHNDDLIILPPGIKIEKIIAAFEEKHAAISKDWFFSGKGVELQYWDSQIAIEILLRLEKEGVPCLPLHDSFIVSFPQERGLRRVMAEAFHKITGRYPTMDAKDSLIKENTKRGFEAMDAEYQMKMEGRNYSAEFRQKYGIYVNSVDEWKNITGRYNIFAYSQTPHLKREVYDEDCHTTKNK